MGPTSAAVMGQELVTLRADLKELPRVEEMVGGSAAVRGLKLAPLWEQGLEAMLGEGKEMTSARTTDSEKGHRSELMLEPVLGWTKASKRELSSESTRDADLESRSALEWAQG